MIMKRIHSVQTFRIRIQTLYRLHPKAATSLPKTKSATQFLQSTAQFSKSTAWITETTTWIKVFVLSVPFIRLKDKEYMSAQYIHPHDASRSLKHKMF